MDVMAFFSKNWAPQAWLSPLVTIVQLDWTVVHNNVAMTDVWYWFYNYVFTNSISSISYIVIADWIDPTLDQRYSRYWWRLTTNTLSDAELATINDLPVAVDNQLSSAHWHWVWNLWVWWWGWGGWDYSWISVEQLNTSVEFIIWNIDKYWLKVNENTKLIKENTKLVNSRWEKLSWLDKNILDSISWLLRIKDDIDVISKASQSNYVKVDVDYNKIIDWINSFKSTVSNADLKEDIYKLLDKMDAYKQLDITEIAKVIDEKLSNLDNWSSETVSCIKNNFKDLDNKIKDLKEFNNVDSKDSIELTKQLYDMMKLVDKWDINKIHDRIIKLQEQSEQIYIKLL